MAFILDELEKIEAGQLGAVYLLYGDDLYLEEEVIGSLSTGFIQKSSAAAEKKVFYGSEDTGDEFLQSLVNIGMFASRQIIIFKEITNLSNRYHKSLLSYLDAPDPNTLLILTAAGGQKSTLLNKLKKHTAIKTLSIWSPYPRQFPVLIQRKIKKEGYQISPEALEILSISTNDSLSHAFAEIEKILIYIGDKPEITLENVRAVVGSEKNYQMADFNQAVAERDLYQAIHICLALIETGIDTPYFISSLYRLFANVWAYQQIHAGTQSDYYPIKKTRELYESAYRNYADRNYKSVFEKLLEVDLKAKSTSISTQDLMIPLIFELLK